MWIFIVKRTGLMTLTALCLTFLVFFLTNLQPNLEKLAKTQGNMRMSDTQVEQWLEDRGYNQPLLVRYGEWLGVAQGFVFTKESGKTVGRCVKPGADTIPNYCGVLQADMGWSSVFKDNVSSIVSKRLGLTGWLMLFVMLVMVPMALIIGVLAGMKEGSRTDRSLSTFAIITTATPEYVSGVIFVVIFASSAVGLRWFKGSSASAMDEITIANFSLPVMTMAFYGMGYIAA